MSTVQTHRVACALVFVLLTQTYGIFIKQLGREITANIMKFGYLKKPIRGQLTNPTIA
jgi:hypothetical protein